MTDQPDAERMCPQCKRRLVDLGVGCEVAVRVLTPEEWPRPGTIAVFCKRCQQRIEVEVLARNQRAA